MPDPTETPHPTKRPRSSGRQPPLGQRLVLIVPDAIDTRAFPALLDAALGSADVAALIVGGASEEEAEAAARVVVPIAQGHGVAALVADQSRIAGRVGADGLHVETGLADLDEAIERFRPRLSVGAGRIATRHAAMEAGERDVDYLFFGHRAGDTHDDAHGKMLDLAEWWAEVAEAPAVVMAGAAIASVADAAATGADFVAVRRAVWEHADGPAAAIAAAAALLTRPAEAAL